MSDVYGFGLIIWDGSKLTRLENSFFKAVGSNITYTIDGSSFVLEDGVTGMVVSRGLTANDPSMLIFRPMASVGLYMTSVSKLLKSNNGDDLVFYGSHNIFPSQVAALAVTEKGTVFFGLMSEMALGCWNRFSMLAKSNIGIVAVDKNSLQFASGLRVTRASPKSPEDLWVLTNRFQKLMTNTMNYNDTNFRLMRNPVNELLSGTNCHNQQMDHSYNFKMH